MDSSARRQLFTALKRARWTVTMGGTGHWQIRTPGGRLVTTISGSPSDYRGPRNALRDLRHAGFRGWPPAHKRKKRNHD